MENKIIKVGVVGLGRGMGIIGDSFEEKNMKIHAICDKNPELVERAKARLDSKGVKDYLVFDDFEDLLKSDVDAIVVATEANRHVPFAIKAMEAGKHVLSEIPTVNSLEEAQMLKACVKAHPELKYMAGENCCYWAFIQTWKKMYEDGKLGDVVYGEAEYLHSRDFKDFTSNPYPEGHWRSYSPAIHYITHSLGPLLYATNDRPKSITCLEPDITYNPYKKAPNNGIALVKTVKGSVFRIYIGFGSYTRPLHCFRLNGTRGTVETDRLKDYPQFYANLSDIPGTFHDKIKVPVGHAYA